MSLLKIGGKNPSGNAMPLNTDASGNLGINIVDSTVAIPVDVQYSQLVDQQPLPVKNIVKRTITTIINAVSVPALSNTGYIASGCDGTEDEVWVAINTNKKPWSLYAKTMFGYGSRASFYPSYAAVATAYSSLLLPAMALIMGIVPQEQGYTAPTTIALAREYRMPIDNRVEFQVTNEHPTDTATITVRIIRVWRNK